MHCPHCGTGLREVAYEGMHIHTCDGCGGEVLGPDELRHIVCTREQRFSPQLRQTLESRDPIYGVPAVERARSLNCPSCNGRMSVVNYGGDSGFYVDRCDACHVMFLDHEELEKIQVLMERWRDEAPAQLAQIANDLELARRRAAESTNKAFAGSRFAFVNAIINRFLDAA